MAATCDSEKSHEDHIRDLTVLKSYMIGHPVVVKWTSTELCDLKFRYVGNWAEQVSFSIQLKQNNESTSQQRPTLDAKHVKILPAAGKHLWYHVFTKYNINSYKMLVIKD